MVDGNALWSPEITKAMEKRQVFDGKEIDTFTDMPENLYEALKKTSSLYPKKIALVDDRENVCTYWQLLTYSQELAAYLYKERKIRKQSHVGILLYNSVEFCVAFLSLIRLGAVAVPLPSKFKRDEVLSLAKLAEVGFVVCDEAYANWFEGMYPKEQVLVISGSGICCGYEKVYKNWASRAKDVAEVNKFSSGGSDDISLIMFTSGTTSKSKALQIRNYNIMHAVEAYRRILHITEKDISVIATPIYHITGLVALLGLFVYTGGTLHLHKFFDAKRVIADARTYGFTFIHASPTVFYLLLQAGEHTPAIPGLVSFACGSGNMPKDKMMSLHRWLPNSQFHTVYGLTETSSPAAIFPDDAAVSGRIGSSGLPIPGIRFKIVDEDNKELPCGQVGEIAVSGSVVLDSYYKQETDNLTDGWLYTGDLGYFDEENYLYVVDRKKDMINRGGEKIWCYDVENAIAGMEEILDSAVVGIPDEMYGEVAAAIVRLKKGSGLTVEKIQQYLYGRMAKYKVPVKIRMVETVPKTPNGKTDKIRIRKMLMED
ncbi:class I adenylate-forming enzyme family protein [Roseburia hominis]